MYNAEARGKRNPIPRNIIKDDLIIGNNYTIKAQEYGLAESKGGSDVPKKMTLIGLYQHNARFQRKAGCTESFTYWDLVRRLVC